MNIQELRIEIDKIDNKIIDLLNKRMNYVNQVGAVSYTHLRAHET